MLSVYSPQLFSTLTYLTLLWCLLLVKLWLPATDALLMTFDPGQATKGRAAAIESALLRTLGIKPPPASERRKHGSARPRIPPHLQATFNQIMMAHSEVGNEGPSLQPLPPIIRSLSPHSTISSAGIHQVSFGIPEQHVTTFQHKEHLREAYLRVHLQHNVSFSAFPKERVDPAATSSLDHHNHRLVQHRLNVYDGSFTYRHLVDTKLIWLNYSLLVQDDAANGSFSSTMSSRMSSSINLDIEPLIISRWISTRRSRGRLDVELLDPVSQRVLPTTILSDGDLQPSLVLHSRSKRSVARGRHSQHDSNLTRGRNSSPPMPSLQLTQNTGRHRRHNSKRRRRGDGRRRRHRRNKHRHRPGYRRRQPQPVDNYRQALIRQAQQNYMRRMCQRRPLKVDFGVLEWDDWIIAPDSYNAYYCAGDCNWPHHGFQNASNHAIIQALFNSMDRSRVDMPCCVPTKLAPLSLLYYNEFFAVTMKTYEDMVVLECGCV